MMIREVGVAWCPPDIELFDPAFEPPMLAVMTFTPLWFDSSLNKALGGNVVCLCPCMLLWTVECVEAILHGDEFMCIHVESCNFCFRGTTHGPFDGFGKNMDWSVELGVVLRT